MRYERYSAAVIRSPRWKAVRLQVKQRDGFKCVSCGAHGRLECDHIKPVRTHPELAFDPENLQTLCITCHSRKTRQEVGLDEIHPERAAWRDLIRAIPPITNEVQSA